MRDHPCALAAWFVASGVLYYGLPNTQVSAPTVGHETFTTCEDELRQIIDLGKLVDWYRWIVVCLTGALLLALAGVCLAALTCGGCVWTTRQVATRSRPTPTKGKDEVLALLAAGEYRR